MLWIILQRAREQAGDDADPTAQQPLLHHPMMRVAASGFEEMAAPAVSDETFSMLGSLRT